MTTSTSLTLLGPIAGRASLERRQRLIGATLLIANLIAIPAAIVHRRPAVEQTLAQAHLDLEPAFTGLAVNSAIAVVGLGTVVIYLLLRSVGGLLDRTLVRSWSGSSRSDRLATRSIELTSLALNVAAFALPSVATVRTAAALPWFGLVVVAAAAWLVLGGHRADSRTRLVSAAVVVGGVLLTCLAYGRWL